MSTEEEGSEEDEQQEARQSKESGKASNAKLQTATVEQFFKKKPKDEVQTEETTKEAEKPTKAKKDKAKEDEEEEAKPKKAKKNAAKEEEEEEAKPKKAKKNEAKEKEEAKTRKARKDEAAKEEKPKKAKKDKAKEEEEAKPAQAKKDKAKEGEEAKPKKAKKNEAEEEEEAKPTKSKKDKAKESEEAKLKKAKKNEAKEEEEAKPKEEKSGSKRKGEGSTNVAKKLKGNAPQLAIKDQEEKSKDQEEKPKDKATKDAGEGKSDAKSAVKTKKKEKGAKQKKKLAKAEKKLQTINSSTHHTEYLRYKRWIKNRKRFPQALVGRIETEDGRANLFRDYIEAGGKVEQILLKHEQMLCEQQRTITDPESPEDKLYFVFVEINIDDIRELKRITKLELSGGVDSETLAAFTKAGGVLDPKAQLASADGKGSQAAMNKALELSQLNKGGGKQNNRKKKKDNGKEDAKELKPNEPIDDAKALQHVVLKDSNTCRENAFKLAPLRMSGPLISQLKAVEVSLTAKAKILQKLIAAKKNKKKHYAQVTGEVQELQKLAKERVDLAKALIRASAKSSKPKSASPGKGSGGKGAEDHDPDRGRWGENTFFDLWLHCEPGRNWAKIHATDGCRQAGDLLLDGVDCPLAEMFASWRWYAKCSKIPMGEVELPLRLEKPGGDVCETMQEYWGKLSSEESVQLLQLQEPGKTIPIFWHTDGVRVYKQQKCWIYSYSSALKKGPSMQSKLLLLLVREALVWKPFTHDRVAEVIAWIQKVLQTGKYPVENFMGAPWEEGSLQAKVAGSFFAGGWRFAFSGCKGDWEAKAYIHKLQRSYRHDNICEHCLASKKDGPFYYKDFSPNAGYLNLQFTHAQFMIMTPAEQQSKWQHVPGWTKDRNLEDLLHVLHQGVACCVIPALVIECIVQCCGGDMTLSDLQKKLQTDVWKHYKAWCRENAVAACGHRFSLIRFGKEAWNHAPELASCYKAYTVKQMIYWVHAYLVDTMPQSRHDLTCASYSMAKVQFNMDVSGPFFQEDLKKDTVLMGRSFLMFYQRIAVQNAGSARKNFKVIPKYEHCYQDEDLMKEIGRICSSCHP
ncbi:unnamed protein product, partial [Symbiodinium sp. CCMP2456]